MTTWLWVLGGIYIGLLALAAYSSWRRTEGESDYLLAGSNVGTMVGLLTYAATLFSTFTLMGMPDFFREHGVGAWIFLAVSDGAQVFFIVWFGYHLRQKAQRRGFRGTAGLIGAIYENRWAGYIYFVGVFLFLVPYVAIQVRGLAIFLEAIFPGALPAWAWSTGIVVIMLIYSEIGGLKAIIYSDILQGLTLLAAVWIIAIGCISYFGGVGGLFEAAQATDEALLSIPGPEGLFSVQFLVASFLAVMLLPATQPQLTTRLMVIKDQKTMYRMAVAIGAFAIAILLPVAAIGMYGSVLYEDATSREFWANVLLFEQADVVGALVIVGLLTAAMSTADSQIFALGTEFRSLISADEKRALNWTKGAIGFFGFAALVFSVVSSDELALLARVSFAGTSMLAPMVVAGVLAKRPPGEEVILATAVGLALFVASLAGWFPDNVAGVRLDLLLLLVLAAFTTGSTLFRKASEPVVEA